MSYIMCANLKCMYPFVQFNFSVYGRKQTDLHTYTCVLQCSPASVGLTLARPNNLASPVAMGHVT